MMDYWTLTGLSNDQISQTFLRSVEEELTYLKSKDLRKFGEEKNPVLTHEKVCFSAENFMEPNGLVIR